MRPDRLVLVAGTATDVGKTWVAAALAKHLRSRGLLVAARKPVQSFERGASRTDAEILAAATGEDSTVVCPPQRWLDIPMAPPMAAEVLGRPPFSVADLAAEISWPAGVDVGLLESVGGVRSPVASDGDTVELAAAIEPDLAVIVADAALGVINAVRCALASLEGWPAVVLLNRFEVGEDLHERNRAWLAERDGTDVLTDVVGLAERILSVQPLKSP